MTEIHIAEIGELFSNLDGFEFMSNQNMLEFDFIVIDSDALRTEAKGNLVSALKERFDDLLDFTSKKNIPIVFLCSSQNVFSDFHDDELTIYSFLGLDVKEEKCSGRKIEINIDSVFSDFLKSFASELEYTIGFSRHPGTSIGNAKSKALSIGFYTKNFVFLPTFNEDTGIDDEEFLQHLYQVCRNIRKTDENSHLANWTNEYHLPGEKTERQLLVSIENEIQRLNQEKINSKNRLSIYQSLKQLWCGSGYNLENAAKQAFIELGFKLKSTEPGRDDIIMEWKDMAVIVEVKGQSKSAAEKNAAQLEKWVSIYRADNEVAPKGLLLINAFREQPLIERSQTSFPHQMLKYSTSRDHCLLTTVQLCNILLYCRENPAKREETIDVLIQTTGIFEHFLNWQDYIENIQEEKLGDSKKKQANSKGSKN